MEFFNHLERFGEHAALITEEEQVSYQQLQKEITMIRSYCNKAALAFCMCSNTIASIEGYLSFLQAKIPVVLISSRIAKESLQKLMDAYRPYYFWMPDKYLEGDVILHYRGYQLSVSGETENRDMHKELALLLTTSGSTGSPKLVRQSYRNLQANAVSIAQYLQITSSDRAVTTLPMHYTYGLSIIHSHLWKGASMVLTDETVVAPEFWDLIVKWQITTFAGVPYTYEMLDKIHFLKQKVSSIRYLTQAGGKLERGLQKKLAVECKEKGIDFIVMYGQTEATARMSYIPVEKAVEKAGSIGVPIPGGKFWLEDSGGEIIELPGCIGELVYQGENVTMGYARCREDLKKGYEHGDVLHTGDMAYFDADGYYYVAGRKKRFLKLFGNRVNMDEVEQMLVKEGVECAVCGQDDHMKIYILHAEEKKNVEDYLLCHTAISKFGVQICVVPEIPRNEAGKILYAKLDQNESCEEYKERSV